MSSSGSGISTRTEVESRESRVESRLWLLVLLLATACAAQAVSWDGVAIAPSGQSSRESAIGGELVNAEIHEEARINLDRTFESSGFDGVPFSIEAGSDRPSRAVARGTGLRPTASRSA